MPQRNRVKHSGQLHGDFLGVRGGRVDAEGKNRLRIFHVAANLLHTVDLFYFSRSFFGNRIDRLQIITGNINIFAG
ncbi:hypothetical protein D3C73_1328910 [compost metagenome]